VGRTRTRTTGVSPAEPEAEVVHDDGPDDPVDVMRLKMYCRTITTPEQFEAIVAAARPKLRAAVRAKLLPLLSFTLPEVQ
jgi:hypothetical protein